MTETTRLQADFYLRTDVLQVARDLLGKVLVTDFDGQRTAGRICEVEAYRASDDRACHAWGNRRTPRTEVLFSSGGHAYIHLCYGIHHLFNVVTGPEGMAQGVLVRAIQPLEGIDCMLRRRKMEHPSSTLSAGPGTLTQALGLTTRLTGQSLLASDSPIWIEAQPHVAAPAQIVATKRIGVDYAGECAAWEWRFLG